MTLVQKILGLGAHREDNVHAALKPAVMALIQSQRCEGATTGFMMTALEDTTLGLAIDERAPKGQRTMYWKTVIGHALDDLQASGLVHCDQIGKRCMLGDERSVPVWRTVEDYEALGRHCSWMLRGPRKDGLPQFAHRQRTHFQNFKSRKSQRE